MSTVTDRAPHLPALGEDPRLDLALALADDELVIGHRHSQWTGVAPHLEEDLAFSSIAQDEIGHAVLWYGLAASRLPGVDDDALGLGRPPTRTVTRSSSSGPTAAGATRWPATTSTTSPMTCGSPRSASPHGARPPT